MCFVNERKIIKKKKFMFTTKAIAGKKGSLKSLKTHNILNINFTKQAPVVKTVYNAIHWINLYLVNNAIG